MLLQKVLEKERKLERAMVNVGTAGEWGHPRRECPHLNEPGKGKGALGALQGGKYGGKGKGKHGKGRKGKSKGKWGKGYNYQ